MVFGFDAPGTAADYYIHVEQHVLIAKSQSLAIHPLLKKPAVAIRMIPIEQKKEEVSLKSTEPKRVKELILYFDTNSSDIRPGDLVKLDLFNKGDHVTLIGMASPEGSDDHNEILSRSRAEAVESILAGRGIFVDRVLSIGAAMCKEKDEDPWKCRQVCISENGACNAKQ